MAVVIEEHETYLSKVKNSLIGVCIGFLLILVSMGLLFWNEGRHVKTVKMLEESQEELFDSFDCSAPFDPSYSDKLMFFTCPLDVSNSGLIDILGVEFPEAAFANRDVQLYQWKESCTKSKQNKLGGGTTTTTKCTYAQGWYSGYINSGSFIEPNQCDTVACDNQENNIPEFDAEGPRRIQVSSLILNGGYTIESSLISDLSSTKSFNVDQSREYIVAPNTTLVVAGNTITLPNRAKVSYAVQSATSVSILARLTANKGFGDYTTKGSRKLKARLKEGTLTSEQFFTDLEDENQMATWLLRFGGFAMMWFGIKSLAGPLTVAPDIIPSIGPIVGDVVQGAVLVVSCFLAAGGSLFVICLAWLFYRPLYAIGCIVILAGVVYFVYQRRQKKEKMDSDSGTVVAKADV